MPTDAERTAGLAVSVRVWGQGKEWGRWGWWNWAEGGDWAHQGAGDESSLCYQIRTPLASWATVLCCCANEALKPHSLASSTYASTIPPSGARGPSHLPSEPLMEPTHLLSPPRMAPGARGRGLSHMLRYFPHCLPLVMQPFPLLLFLVWGQTLVSVSSEATGEAPIPGSREGGLDSRFHRRHQARSPKGGLMAPAFATDLAVACPKESGGRGCLQGPNRGVACKPIHYGHMDVIWSMQDCCHPPPASAIARKKGQLLLQLGGQLPSAPPLAMPSF